MKSLEFKFIIAPLLLLIGLIVGLHFLNFDYIDQAIIVSGPIMAALISMYVVKNKDDENKDREQKDRNTRLEYVLSLVEAGLRSLKNEAENYKEFVSQITKEGMAQTGFKFSSFHLIKQSLDYNQGDFYTSIANKYPNDIDNAKKKYLSLTNATQNALMLQENAKNEYEKFIESYNIQANNYRRAQLDLNNIFTNLTVTPSGNTQFDNTFFEIIRSYNEKIFNKEISPLIFSDVRNELIKPIARLLNSGFVPRNAFYELQRVFKDLEVSLNKMEEIQNTTVDHIDNISNHLIDVADRLETTLEFFGVEVTDGSYLELKPIEDEKLHLKNTKEPVPANKNSQNNG